MEFPDYRCEAYRRQAPLWAYLDDVFTGSEAWLNRDESGQIHPNAKTERYLPKNPAEDSKNYLSRLSRSPFSDRFAQAIRDFVGFVAINGVKFENVSPEFLTHWLNIDNRGTRGDVFLAQVGLAAMRRGHTFLLVDFPSGEAPRSQADFLLSGRHPYWLHVPAPNVLNWRTVKQGNQEVLIQVTIQERIILPAGAFGEQEIIQYRRLTPGRYDIFTIEGEGKERKAIHHPERSGVCGFVQSDGTIQPFNFIPLICVYGGEQVGFFESRPPLKSLADINVTHYQVKSDHLQKIHKCSHPVPTLRDSFAADDAELVIGSDRYIRIRDPNGYFRWEEPLATSIEQSRREVIDLETAMDFIGAEYLVKPADRQAATVSQMQAAKVESSLSLFVASFEQGLNAAIALHHRYLGKPAGVARLSTKLSKSGPDAQLAQIYISLFSALQQLPPNLALQLLQLLKLSGFLPEGFNVNEVDTNGRTRSTPPTEPTASGST